MRLFSKIDTDKAVENSNRILQGAFDTEGYLYSGILFTDSSAIDAFGRLRVSNPTTLFDSKQIFKDSDLANNVENFPLFYDNQEVSGTGSVSTFNVNTASTRLSVSNVTSGKRVRQTKMRFNYQPGKSMLIMQTFKFDDQKSGITLRKGAFDDNNGFFLEDDGESYNFIRRTYVTGEAIDNRVAQSSWNIDKMDGTGVSGVNIDFTKTQILLLDYEWLGVGRLRFGFVVDGLIRYAHSFNNANNLESVYVSTPNLPLRSEVINDGTGQASYLDDICATVISEGGTNELGVLRYASTNGVQVDANVADSIYAIIGLRLKSNYIGMSIKLVDVSLISETNDDFEWMIILNPVIAGTFTYVDESRSAMQVARGATENTVTGGYKITGGWASLDTQSATKNLENALQLGASIGGTRDTIVLCVRPLSANADIQGSLVWREIS